MMTHPQRDPLPTSKKPRLGETTRLPQAVRNFSTGLSLLFSLGSKAAGDIA